jgi:aminoglycoside phosphotransferase family enzyme
MTPLQSEPLMRVLWDTSDVPCHDVIVAALRRPDAYSDGASSVEVIETHRAWVFLTNAHAYKLAKAQASHRHDAASLEERLRNCQRELTLNRRLGRDVYQGVVPLACARQGYRVDGQGPTVEWLVAMRRLPRHLMLDVAIAERSVHVQQVDALAEELVSFYGHAVPAPMAAAEYRGRLLADIDAKHAALARPDYGLDPSSSERLAAALHAWVAHRAPQLECRASTLVDAHGDLRPEHICLEPRPVIIDCLEFDRGLRRLDPASEVAFLALECRRLGAAWVGSRLLSHLAPPFRLTTSELSILVQLPPRCLECVADGDVSVFMGVVTMVLTIDDDLRSGNANVEPHGVELATVMVLVGSIHRSSPTRDVGVKARELLSLVADAALDRLRVSDPVKRDLTGFLHDQLRLGQLTTVRAIAPSAICIARAKSTDRASSGATPVQCPQAAHMPACSGSSRRAVLRAPVRQRPSALKISFMSGGS